MTIDLSDREWTFLTNYAQVLLVIEADPLRRLRDVANDVGITERAAQRIVRELVDEGYLTRRRVGRRNQYTVHRNRPLRHSLQGGRTVGDLIDAFRLPRV